ncbi:MAG: protoheme IX farnesyltransferase [Rhizobiales bacterium TMED94]|nr:protoheme IX farnesyltransferase [Rhodobiaceae bacterium]RPF85916.1 MAG: protoheme IX farnesyltransferase [Rhizobiales bacterium TMED94]|tara:strand:- start:756 stop:1619 length:864 start_codon:yes stop_codon:yes gene_type:complete
MFEKFKLLVNLFKVRISLTIMLCAISGVFVVPNNNLNMLDLFLVGISTFLASAGVSAFNQYFERDLDALMPRTSKRPFVTGELRSHILWPVLFLLIIFSGLIISYVFINPYSCLYNFLGALFYGAVYTIWLKRKSIWNIVIGGLAGSFATLAGSAAVNPIIGPEAVILSVILFLWTPPHFWSLAMAIGDDYEKASIPMLPNTLSNSLTTYIILFHTIILVFVTALLMLYSSSLLYIFAIFIGGGYFIWTSILLAIKKTKSAAMKNFFGSFIQLGLLLILIIIDGIVI